MPTVKHGGRLAELFGIYASGNENMTGHTINADSNVSVSLQKNFQNINVTGNVPKIMIANVMSLVPKLIEILEFINRNEICIALLTETWLRESMADAVVNFPGYTISRKDRSTNNSHGGVCAYVREAQVKFKHLEGISYCDKHEVLWLYLRPSRLPRGFSCIIVAVLYHPPGSDQDSILDHFFLSLGRAESCYPNCGLIVAGDFNQLGVKGLEIHFRFKQIVKKPTRKDAILDYVLTNIHDYYDAPQILPPFDLSDHNTIIVSPKKRVTSSATKKTIFIRDQRPSCKAAMVRHLSSLQWHILFASSCNCKDMIQIFQEIIKIRCDLLMPVQKITKNTAVAPWMT